MADVLMLEVDASCQCVDDIDINWVTQFRAPHYRVVFKNRKVSLEMTVSLLTVHVNVPIAIDAVPIAIDAVMAVLMTVLIRHC